MEDDGFLKEVERAFRDNIRENIAGSEAELWAFAKERASFRIMLDQMYEKAQREGKNFLALVVEENARRLAEKENKLN